MPEQHTMSIILIENKVYFSEINLMLMNLSFEIYYLLFYKGSSKSEMRNNSNKETQSFQLTKHSFTELTTFFSDDLSFGFSSSQSA